ncbi:triphosphoribosyl-dephospho-CoA synthase [Rubrivivax gelatinosus]|uniref:triphosphoribosyl-dephospho-CoA synthase n=1 Tax=Rubrivivax gelatinosus TaxID=28068 RepID=UPI001904EC00|nr:triphosphoribosyl-dephospho-CoA synthase [Rubrivivax gelatinosus]MBK1612319.1 triphosphoribosyl-dephospho-CoA synthase [Rubrivivax gelatinosus]
MNSRDAFVLACTLDVAVRKPGNVSMASAGHRMQAQQFLAAAAAAAGPVTQPGASVGARIEAAVRASQAAAGCNTNLGIVLLAAPLARAAEAPGATRSMAALADALAGVLGALDVADAALAFAAIAHANPGGLGQAPEQDVHSAPELDLRAAMALAADRDRIAWQYTRGFADVLELAGLLRVAGVPRAGLQAHAPDAATTAAVQQVFVECLGRWPDSHIVRKHGAAVAQTVLHAAQRWRGHPAPDTDPGFAAWDISLKSAGLNPGTSADLTVAALFTAALLGEGPGQWHGT